MKQQFSVGIDIGTSTTRVIISSGTSIIGVGTSVTSGMRHGYVSNREEVVASLKKAIQSVEREAKVKVRTASLVIGGVGIGCESATGTSVVSRADSVITKLDIEKAITDAEGQLELKNKTILHALPTKFNVDGKELPGRPDGVQGLKLEVQTLFVTCFSQHVDDLVSVVQELGIRVSELYPSAVVLQSILLSELQRNLGCVLVDIGTETTTVCVYENNLLTATHVFPIGALDITKDIALGLRISPEEAENVKLGAVSFTAVPKKKLDEIIEARLSDIFDLINKYLKKIGRSALLPAGAIIVGGGAMIADIDVVAKTGLKIPARRATITIPVTGTTTAVGKNGVITDPRFAVAYGASIYNEGRSARKTSTREVDTEGIITAIRHFFKQLMP